MCHVQKLPFSNFVAEKAYSYLNRSTEDYVAEWRSRPLAFDRMELSVLRRGDYER